VADNDLDFFEQESELFRIAYERKARDKSALLNTIMLSILFRQPLPEWAAKAFEDAYNFVMMGGARSWNEVFGDPHPGKHKRSVALKNRKYEVHRRVRVLHEGGERRGLDALRQDPRKTPPGLPIDEALFERVGRELGQEMNPGGKPISKTVISDLYYRVEHILRRLQAETSEK
jgi:hypothetical protein